LFLAASQWDRVATGPGYRQDFSGSRRHLVSQGCLSAASTVWSMSASDFEADAYDLGTTSVVLVRAGNVIQLVFNNRLDARVYYAEGSFKV
jgi:hypothetical protein